MNKKNYCNQADCPNGINCLDIHLEEVAIAALELLSGQTYEPPAYKGMLGIRSKLTNRNKHRPADQRVAS